MGGTPQRSLLPGWIPRLALAMAMAVALLLGAGQARASAASQCVGELASWIPEAPRTEPRTEEDAYWELWMCDAAAASHPISHREIPICLSEGASDIAPRTVQPIDDSRIEATPRCNPLDGPDQWAPSPDQRPDHPVPALGHAVLPTPPSPAPAGATDLVLPRCAENGTTPGYRYAVYRPPRA